MAVAWLLVVGVVLMGLMPIGWLLPVLRAPLLPLMSLGTLQLLPMATPTLPTLLKLVCTRPPLQRLTGELVVLAAAGGGGGPLMLLELLEL